MLSRRYALWGVVSVNLVLIAAILFADLFADTGTEPQVANFIRLNLQLPLVVTAILVGSALCVSAASLQVVLNNPLADPGIIGITSGASLAAACLLLLSPVAISPYLYYLLPLACFVGALCSTAIIYKFARHLVSVRAAVILAGVAISTMVGAIIGWMYLFTDATALRNLTFWLMGSLHQADWWVITVASPIIILSLWVQLRNTRQLNLLYAGEVATQVAGIDTKRLHRQILLAAAMGVGAAVSMAGSIAFVGLLVPHAIRLLFGHDNRFVLPMSATVGAMVMLIAASLSEFLFVSALPVSMLTATIGGPVLIYALYKGQLK